MERHHNFEILFYEHIGIKRFKRLVLSFEAFRRRKTGGRNANYHLQGLTFSAAEQFFPHLLRNGAIHSLGLLIAAAYCFFDGRFQFGSLPLDVVVYATVIPNLYCIFLQRYTYLRIRALQRKKQALGRYPSGRSMDMKHKV